MADNNNNEQKDTVVDVDDEAIEISAENEASRIFMEKCGKVLPITFAILALLTLIVWIVGFAATDEQETMVWIVLITCIICSILGAWAVFKYGVIQDQIDKLKVQNGEYKDQIAQLSEERGKLKGHVDELNGQVQELQRNADELAEQTKQFDGLINELKEIAGDNEDVLKMIDETNDIFTDMRHTILEHDRAQLLTNFYEYAFRDNDDKMDKREYKRFLARLSPEQREQFESKGTFEKWAGDDGLMDLDEFTHAIEQVLGDVDDQLAKEFAEHK